jgi:hypothetical protein
LKVPVGIEVPDVEEAGGVVAPEDLVDTANGVRRKLDMLT